MKEENKPKTSLYFRILNTGLTLIFLFMILILFSHAHSTGQWQVFHDLIIKFFFMFIGLILGIHIHELGHLLIGSRLNYKLISFSIGFLYVYKENNNLKLKIKKTHFAGSCTMLPPQQKLTNFKYGLYYAGGILFNFSTVIIMLIPYLLLKHNYAKVSEYFFTILVASFLIGLFNFLPMTVNNNPSDGKLIWSILLNNSFAEKLIETNYVTTQLSAGVHSKDVEIRYYPDIDRPDSFDMMILLYSYFKALGNNNLTGLIDYSKVLENNMHAFPKQNLPVLYYELCFVGCITNDNSKANYYYEKVRKTLRNDKDVNGMRVKAYYEYYSNGNTQAAMIYCEQALKVVDKFPIKGQSFMEKDLVERLKFLLYGKGGPPCLVPSSATS